MGLHSVGSRLSKWLCIMWVTSIPQNLTWQPQPTTLGEEKEKKKKKCERKKKKHILGLTRVAPNQLHLGSEFMTSPWQHRGNKQQCLDRSRYLPSAQTEPPPPGSFRKEVSAAAKCRVNRAGRGWPLALVRSDQHLHPSLIKRWGSSVPEPRSKGAGLGDELCVSVI